MERAARKPVTPGRSTSALRRTHLHKQTAMEGLFEGNVQSEGCIDHAQNDPRIAELYLGRRGNVRSDRII